MKTPEKETTRFTVDLDWMMHQALSELSEQQGMSKAELIREAIAQMVLVPVNKGPFPSTETIRFTVDLSLSLHHQLSMLAVYQRCKKADLVRGAIARLLEQTP